MKALFIDGKRNGYGPDQCGRTLTVGELIEILEDFDEDRPVYLRNDSGYTYGSITERDINAAEDLGYGEEGEDELGTIARNARSGRELTHGREERKPSPTLTAKSTARRLAGKRGATLSTGNRLLRSRRRPTS